MVLPLLLVYNLTLAVPATPATLETPKLEADVSVVLPAVELGESVSSGTAELLAAFQEAFPPPVESTSETTTTTAPPTTTTTATTTSTTTTAAPTTTTSIPPTTHAHVTTTTVDTSVSPIDPYPWKGSWPEIAMWEKLAFCESTGDWYINSGNGYFGGLQFTLVSWEYVGGTGRPDQASREEQIYRGALLWERQTWKGWPGCTGRTFGWSDKQIRL